MAVIQDQDDEREVGLRPEDIEGASASAFAWQAARLDQPDFVVFKHGSRTRSRNRPPQSSACLSFYEPCTAAAHGIALFSARKTVLYTFTKRRVRQRARERRSYTCVPLSYGLRLCAGRAQAKYREKQKVSLPSLSKPPPSRVWSRISALLAQYCLRLLKINLKKGWCNRKKGPAARVTCTQCEGYLELASAHTFCKTKVCHISNAAQDTDIR